MPLIPQLPTQQSQTSLTHLKARLLHNCYCWRMLMCRRRKRFQNKAAICGVQAWLHIPAKIHRTIKHEDKYRVLFNGDGVKSWDLIGWFKYYYSMRCTTLQLDLTGLNTIKNQTTPPYVWPHPRLCRDLPNLAILHIPCLLRLWSSDSSSKLCKLLKNQSGWS